MNKETKNMFLLGLFTVLGLILFTIGAYYVGDKQDLFSRTFELNAVFTEVNGLTSGNNVRFSGIDIGTVKEVKILSDSSVGVKMEIREEHRQFIKTDATAKVGTDGLMGNKLVNIVHGRRSNTIVSSGFVLQTIPEADIGQMLETFSHTNDNLRIISQELISVIDMVKQSKGLFGTLISDTVITSELKMAVNSFTVTGSELALLGKNMNMLLDKVERGEGSIGALLNDTALTYQLSSTLSNFENTGKEATHMVEKINGMLQGVNDGHGAAGAILKDPELVGQINSTMENLNQSSAKLTELLEAAKHNFLFKRYFKRKAKGK